MIFQNSAKAGIVIGNEYGRCSHPLDPWRFYL
jgi:hypothetical protein